MECFNSSPILQLDLFALLIEKSLDDNVLTDPNVVIMGLAVMSVDKTEGFYLILPTIKRRSKVYLLG